MWFIAYHNVKVVSFTFLLVCLECLKESTLGTMKNVFCFTYKALFITFLDIQI